MKFITDIEKLAGKTIKSAASVDCGESAALIFTDGTCAYFEVRHYGDFTELYLNDTPDDYLKHEAGIITDAEYSAIQARIEADHAVKARAGELKRLAELKAKYEPERNDEEGE